MAATAYPTLARRGFKMPVEHGPKQRGSAYHGASQGRRLKNWRPSDGGINAILTANLPQLRRRSRDQIRNDRWARSLVSKWVSNVIGTGIRPRWQKQEQAYRETAQELWDDWVIESDADGVLDFYGQQALAVRSMFESGEVFLRKRLRRFEDVDSVPLQYQILEADHCPLEWNFNLRNGNKVRAGVEFDAIGRRVAYWMYRDHPRDTWTGTFDAAIARRIPADQIIHLFEPLRPGQIRGEPKLTAVLLQMHTLDKYDDATLVRQEMGTLFAGFIQRQLDEDDDEDVDPFTGKPIEEDEDGIPMVEWEPGMMQDLEPGEEVKFSDPPDAGSSYKDFIRQQLLGAGAGTDVPYEVFTGDMAGVNDRTLRGILNEFRRSVQAFQHQKVIHMLCRPVVRDWTNIAVASGDLDAPNFSNRRERRRYLRVTWVPQAWKYLHPVQDVQADKMEVRSGFQSLDQKRQERGADPLAVDEENAASLERQRKLGLRYDTDASQPDGSASGTTSAGESSTGESNDSDSEERRNEQQ